MLVPRLSSRFWTAADEPLPTATSTITAPTPIMMPSMVSAERSLLADDALQGDADVLDGHAPRPHGGLEAPAGSGGPAVSGRRPARPAPGGGRR